MEDPATDSAIEPEIEPMVAPAGEPLVDTLVKPAIEPALEPANEQAFAPAIHISPEPAPVPVHATAPPLHLEGYVDFYGYHTLAGGWCIDGWITRHDNLVQNLNHIEANFTGETLAGLVHTITFRRHDITDRDAIGFLILLPAPVGAPGRLQSLRLNVAGGLHSISPVPDAYLERDQDVVERANFILGNADPGLRRNTMDVRLNGLADQVATGFIEYFGYHHAAGGWFFAGWISRTWSETDAPTQMLVNFEDDVWRSSMVNMLCIRSELPDGASGFVFFVPGKPGTKGALTSLAFRFGVVKASLLPIDNLPHLREAELTARLKANISQAKPGPTRERLGNILARRPYVGEDTLEALSPSIFMYIDQAFICGASGLLLMGWLLAKPNAIRELRLRCGDQMAVLHPQSFVRIERNDVLEGFAKYGYEDANCGFIAYVPGIVQAGAPIYIEAETNSLEIGYRNIPAPAFGGMNAIKQLLSAVDVRFESLGPAFEHVLGPAIEAMNAQRMATRTGRQVVEYGTVPRAPKYSVIIPLYGRLDFAEYQMALFSAGASNADVEYVFVLDDPPKRREAQHLFAAIHERFGIPFRAVLLERNLGFAPANNVGLEYCHGEYLVYLNSDVFPITPDWLERLSARLEADASLGVVGPMLLFEDGAVQHRGMYFEKLEEYANWHFCQHVDKGLRYDGPGGMEHFICITGACMMLKRDLAQQLGGFDEIFIVGDFEDSDMCLKILGMGLKCGVDHDVRLYHLERKSQISSAQSWRANLTAYNAWQHECRWGRDIAHKQIYEYKVPV